MAAIDLGRVMPIYRGSYDATRSYELNDIVLYEGGLYWHCGAAPTSGIAPTDTAVWRTAFDGGELSRQIHAEKSNAEAWAVGKRDGVDVGSTDEAYQNNAKYYSETVGDRIARVEQQVASPFVIAATAADMTDTSKAYVYVGSEPDYVSGGWYYWDGIEWMLGGTETDPTLTVAGAAADAAAVGSNLQKIDAKLIGFDGELFERSQIVFDWDRITGSWIRGKRNGLFYSGTGKSLIDHSRTRIDPAFRRGYGKYADGVKRFTFSVPEPYYCKCTVFSKYPSFATNADNSAIYVKDIGAISGANATREISVELEDGYSYAISTSIDFDTLTDELWDSCILTFFYEKSKVEEIKKNLRSSVYAKLLGQVSTSAQGVINGACTDGVNVYAYAQASNAIFKMPIDNPSAVETKNYSEDLGHGNDMTYNPEDGKLYLACMQNGEVAVFDAETLEFERKVVVRDNDDALVTAYGIAYDRQTQRFLLAASGSDGKRFVWLDSNLAYQAEFQIARPENFTLQGIETDGKYIYRALSSSNGANYCAIMGMDGTWVAVLPVDGGSSEIEAICYDWVHNLFYAAYNTGSKGWMYYFEPRRWLEADSVFSLVDGDTSSGAKETVMPLGLHTMPESDGVLNVIKRARQFTDIEWSPAVDLPRVMRSGGRKYEGVFRAGVTYKGMPYSSSKGSKVTPFGYTRLVPGHQISFDTFMTAISNPRTFVSDKSQYKPDINLSTMYGSTCCGLVSYAFGLPWTSTEDFAVRLQNGEFVSKGVIGESFDISQIALGDLVAKFDEHTAVITDIIREAGNVVEVEISENTTSGEINPAVVGGQLGGIARRRGQSAANFLSGYAGYTVCRYVNIANVPYEPFPWVRVGDELDKKVSPKYPCLPYMGEGFVYKEGYIPNSKILVFCPDMYTYLYIYKDGEFFNRFLAAGDVSINFANVGKYEAFLANVDENDAITEKTSSCHWSVAE